MSGTGRRAATAEREARGNDTPRARWVLRFAGLGVILAIGGCPRASALTAQDVAPAASPAESSVVRERDVAVPMRDGVLLRADVLRPPGGGRFPVLVYRTPYGKADAQADYTLFAKAVARGYAVVVQDVRGRYASDGEFAAYRHEGRDGYDTIEWAAGQPWSNGDVGTFGLSYPGAVQWLAAVESPPHLRAMVPAMTYATPDRFFYAGGVWDQSWATWLWFNIAPDLRRRTHVAGATTYEAAEREWPLVSDRVRRHLPLLDLPDFQPIAPWYYEWLRHPPRDPWWSWADLRGKYARTDAAVLNLSGWHDEVYGPHGAITNYTELVSARAGRAPKARLVVGPWAHGVAGMARPRVGERDVGAAARLDYDETVLRWMDRWVRGVDNGVDREPPVRVFVMGDDRWRESDRWPIAGVRPDTMYLTMPAGGRRGGALGTPRPLAAADSSVIVSDPAHPVVDPYAERSGAHDYRALATRPDVLTFETAPLEHDVEVVGAITAEIQLSADVPDTDLWVKVLDVAPDGTALNLMSPGSDVLRASYRDGTAHRSLLEPGRVYLLRLSDLFTANTFRRGHRIRVHLLTTFFPHFSRNLHTGALETASARMRSARVTVHHDRRHPSRLIFPVVPRDLPRTANESR